MVKVRKDLTGRKFGHLTVIRQDEDYVKPSGAREAQWLCECDCPAHTRLVVIGSNLTTNHTTSCGCAQIEATSKANTKHGLRNTRIYNIYMHMHARCENPNNDAYGYYGAQGVYVCPEWSGENGVANFNEWALANGYRDDLTIDRKNRNGPYSPDNCHWVDEKVQSNNRCSVHNVDLNGDNLSMAQCAIALGVDYDYFRRILIQFNYDINQTIAFIQQNRCPINGIYYVDQQGFPIPDQMIDPNNT